MLLTVSPLHCCAQVEHLAAARQQQQLAELLTTVMRLYLVARGVDPEGHDMKRDEVCSLLPKGKML
jgi:hypothetical protein